MSEQQPDLQQVLSNAGSRGLFWKEKHHEPTGLGTNSVSSSPIGTKVESRGRASGTALMHRWGDREPIVLCLWGFSSAYERVSLSPLLSGTLLSWPGFYERTFDVFLRAYAYLRSLQLR